MAQQKKRGKRPPADWMKKIAQYKMSDKDIIVDYEYVAKKFGTKAKSIRSLSSKIFYEAQHIPNPQGRGGTIKKFKLNALVRAVREYVAKQAAAE